MKGRRNKFYIISRIRISGCHQISALSRITRKQQRYFIKLLITAQINLCRMCSIRIHGYPAVIVIAQIIRGGPVVVYNILRTSSIIHLAGRRRHRAFCVRRYTCAIIIITVNLKLADSGPCYVIAFPRRFRNVQLDVPRLTGIDKPSVRIVVCVSGYGIHRNPLGTIRADLEFKIPGVPIGSVFRSKVIMFYMPAVQFLYLAQIYSQFLLLSLFRYPAFRLVNAVHGF